MPVEAQVLKGGPYAPHKIQGIGAELHPGDLRREGRRSRVRRDVRSGVDTARKLAKQEGILVGISSGAIAYAALADRERARRRKARRRRAAGYRRALSLDSALRIHRPRESAGDDSADVRSTAGRGSSALGERASARRDRASRPIPEIVAGRDARRLRPGRPLSTHSCLNLMPSSPWRGISFIRIWPKTTRCCGVSTRSISTFADSIS